MKTRFVSSGTSEHYLIFGLWQFPLRVPTPRSPEWPVDKSRNDIYWSGRLQKPIQGRKTRSQKVRHFTPRLVLLKEKPPHSKKRRDCNKTRLITITYCVVRLEDDVDTRELSWSLPSNTTGIVDRRTVQEKKLRVQVVTRELCDRVKYVTRERGGKRCWFKWSGRRRIRRDSLPNLQKIRQSLILLDWRS